MPNIYRKTAKGIAEIETRANKLAPRFRQALILVDGKRSEVDLAKLILQQPTETLTALAEQGFIEWIATLAPVPAPPQFSVPAAAPPPTAAAAAATAATGLDLTTRRRDAARLFIDLVGPMADALAVRMERAGNHEDLVVLIELAQKVIANTRGKQAAETYGKRLGLP